MASPPRTLILDNIESVLTAITIANGYKTDVATVERVVRVYPGEQELPLLGIAFSSENFEHEAFEGIKIKMRGAIFGHVQGDTAELRSEAVDNVQDDVIAALYVDASRGGHAADTRLAGEGMNDVADPDGIDSRGGVARVIIPIEITYYRTGDAS